MAAPLMWRRAAVSGAEAAELDSLETRWETLGADGAARRLKENRLRTVLLAELPSGRLVIKQYRYLKPLDRLRSWLLAAHAEREFHALERLRRDGFAVPRPLAWGERRSGVLPVEGGLVMEEVPDATPLVTHLAELAAAGPAATARREARRRMLEVGAYVRRLHERGVLHPDLHGANFLLSRADDQIWLIDFHSCLFPGHVPGPARRAALAKVLHGFWTSVERETFRWFLAAYLLDRGLVARVEAEIDSDAPLDHRLVGADAWAVVDDSVREVTRRVERIEERRLASRSRRCLVDSTSFAVGRERRRRVFRLRAFSSDDMRAALDEHRPEVRTIKDTGRARVWRTIAGGRSVIVKACRLSPVECLASLFGEHRLRRAWRAAHALRVRQLPAPQGLALVEERAGPLVHRAWLVQEAVPGGVPLDELLWTEYGGDEPAPSRGDAARRKFALARAAGSLLRELHAAGVRLHDASPQNVVVAVELLRGAMDALPAPDGDDAEIAAQRHAVGRRLVWLVDLDDVRVGRAVEMRRRLRNLVQLGNMPEGHVSAADRLRGLRAYDGGAGEFLAPEVRAVLRAGLEDEALRTIARMTRAARNGGEPTQAPETGS